MFFVHTVFFSFQNNFQLNLCILKNLSHSINTCRHVTFCTCWLLSLLINIFIWFCFLSRLLLIGTLCFGVLDHFVWSNRKRTEPGRDASLLQTDTPSKHREPANHAEVSSFWPEFKRQDTFSHLKLIRCLAWQYYKWRNSNMFQTFRHVQASTLVNQDKLIEQGTCKMCSLLVCLCLCTLKAAKWIQLFS